MAHDGSRASFARKFLYGFLPWFLAAAGGFVYLGFSGAVSLVVGLPAAALTAWRVRSPEVALKIGLVIVIVILVLASLLQVILCIGCR